MPTGALVREELRDVLTRKPDPTPKARKEIEARWKTATPVADAPAGLGDDDARLLDAARSAKAKPFVTGDRALLDLRMAGEMPIVSPKEAYERLVRVGQGPAIGYRSIGEPAEVGLRRAFAPPHMAQTGQAFAAGLGRP